MLFSTFRIDESSVMSASGDGLFSMVKQQVLAGFGWIYC